MNSRDSAAFDESILLATQQAFRESRAMAMELGVGGSKGRKRKKRDDDDMEPVKEEEEEYHDDYRQDTKIKRENGHKEDRQDDSAVDPSLASHDEEHDDEGEGDDQDDQSADANGTAAPRKRRRRRGAGALFTAPNKKRAATARAKKTNGDAGDGAQHEGFTVNSIQIEDASSAVEDDANARKRKRDDANQDGER